jgi:hypothetical protein
VLTLAADGSWRIGLHDFVYTRLKLGEGEPFAPSRLRWRPARAFI